MKNGKVYVTETPIDGWIETGIALGVPSAELGWLEANVSYSPHLALVNQWSRNGIHWQYDTPLIGGHQRALLLRRPTHKGKAAFDDVVGALRERMNVVTATIPAPLNAGRLARMAGRKISENPYPADSEAFSLWEEGWRENEPFSGADILEYFPEYR